MLYYAPIPNDAVVVGVFVDMLLLCSNAFIHGNIYISTERPT